MSRFFSSALSHLSPYTPGEQPLTSYIKLNTNESPFPPAAHAELSLQLYPDPECRALREAFSKELGVSPSNLIFTNGSDEALAFIFLSLCERGAAFPDLTYGFYSVYADLFRVPKKIIPLREDFTLALSDYAGLSETLFIANPNAPTGLAHTCAELEELIAENPDRLVVVDEAYVDFSNEPSAVVLLEKYPNLIILQTLSKSWGMASLRLGMCFSHEYLAGVFSKVKAPYNVGGLTQRTALETLSDLSGYREKLEVIKAQRDRLEAMLRACPWFEHVWPSQANFVLASSPYFRSLYRYLTEHKVVVRVRDIPPRIPSALRITVGTPEQNDCLEQLLADFRPED